MTTAASKKKKTVSKNAAPKKKLRRRKSLIKAEPESLIQMDTDDLKKLIESIDALPREKAGEQVANLVSALTPTLSADEAALAKLAARVKAAKALREGLEILLCEKQRAEGIESQTYTTTDGNTKITVKATTSKIASLLADKDKVSMPALGADELKAAADRMREEFPDADDRYQEAFLQLTRGDRDAFVKVSVNLQAKRITDLLKLHKEAEETGRPVIDDDLPERLEGHVELKYNNKNELTIGEKADIRK